MTKRVVDLIAGELDKAAREAWSAAAKNALARGLPVTGSLNGRRLRYHPDGRVEDLGPIASLPEQNHRSDEVLPVTMPQEFRTLICETYLEIDKRLVIITMIERHLDYLNSLGRYDQAREFLRQETQEILDDARRLDAGHRDVASGAMKRMKLRLAS